jgi:hypothetical protein
MATLFPKLYSVIAKNPSRHATLPGSAACAAMETGEVWDIFELHPLDPPGALSGLLYHTDPMYCLGSPILRKQILTEHLLVLHERVEKELVGRRFPRKKIQDILAGQVSLSSPAPSALLEEVLCELFQVQKLLISPKDKAITFSPPDPRLWRTDRPVYVSDLDNAWIYESKQTCSLASWLQEKHDAGWRIQWPTAEGTLEQIKTAVLQKNLTAHPAFGQTKVKKEDWARVLGFSQSLEVLGALAFAAK